MGLVAWIKTIDWLIDNRRLADDARHCRIHLF